MYKMKKIKSADMFPIVKEILESGSKAWITVTGMSMFPFLREDEDCVELTHATIDTINRGDIVLIQRYTGEYILHRVYKKENNIFYMVGDAQRWIEGPLNPEQLIAVVEVVKRKDREISCNNKMWKLLVLVWMNIIPVRPVILKVLRGIRKVFKGISNSKVVKVHGD